ncbi:MAG: DNA polymerase III subunit delta [Deltaproteobacteria bacterium]|jgi:DNA polymerase III delta subunit|nr:DNA polymerase III subunit delta [Deltaproteobacteria bacterium]
MADMNPAAFQKEIVSPQRQPLYVVTGGDPAGMRGCLEAARKAVKPGVYSFNYRQFAFEDLQANSFSALRSESQTNPLGTPPKIVVVTVAEGDKPTAEQLEAFARIRPGVNPRVTVVLFVKAALSAKLNFTKEMTALGLMVECKIPDRYGLPAWVLARCQEKGLKAGPDTARLMIDRLGSGPGVLLSEIEKLSLYPGTETPITARHISELVCFGPTAEIYELAQPLAQGNLGAAVPILLDLLEKVEPLPLLYALGTYFGRLLRVRSALDAGRFSDEELMTLTGGTVSAVRQARSQAEDWPVGKIRLVTAVLGDTHRSLFTSGLPADLLMEAACVKIGCIAKDIVTAC